MDINNMQIFTDGHLPIIAAVYDQLQIASKINEFVEWDKEKCILNPGQAVKALILNMLSGYEPLYMISEFFKDKDVEKLIGEGINYTHINEFCIGRTLDKVYNANPKKVYSNIVLTALNIEKIDVKSIHWDTTSKSLTGEYSTPIVPEAGERKPIDITYGYSKDMRKDLKQMKFGIGTTRDKLPLFCDVLSGNLDDKKWNGNTIKTIEEELKAVNLKDILHVADSALITKSNLKLIDDGAYKFISRLPSTFSLEDSLIKRAIRQGDKWIELGKISEKENSSTYKIQSFKDQIDGKKYRFLVCHSSELDSLKIKTLEKNIEKEEKEVAIIYKKYINKDGYYCENDCIKTIDKFQNKLKLKYHTIAFNTFEEEKKKKRSQKGRPGKDEKIEKEIKYNVQYVINKNAEKIAGCKEKAGMFVLITNQLNKENLSDRDILIEYKHQNSVESTFRVLKDTRYVEEIFLKKVTRIEAYGYIMVLAVLIMNLIERRIRENLKKEDKEISLPGRRKTFTPTATAMFKVFKSVKVVAIATNENVQRLIYGGLDENQKRILKLCGLSEDLYLVNSGKVLFN